MNDLSSHGMRLRNFSVSSRRERLNILEVETLESREGQVAQNLRASESRASGFQDLVADGLEDRSRDYLCLLVRSLSNLDAAQCHTIGDGVNKSITLFRVMIAAHEVEIIVASPNIAGQCAINQYINPLTLLQFVFVWQYCTLPVPVES